MRITEADANKVSLILDRKRETRLLDGHITRRDQKRAKLLVNADIINYRKAWYQNRIDTNTGDLGDNQAALTDNPRLLSEGTVMLNEELALIDAKVIERFNVLTGLRDTAVDTIGLDSVERAEYDDEINRITADKDA
jgi:hypothetical protein